LNDKVLIFTPQISPRLIYIFRFIFKEFIGAETDFTSDINLFSQFNGAKLNYSFEDIENCISVRPHFLLLEKGLRQHKISVTEWEGEKIFFQVHDKADIPFDLFAAAFYLVSRYEEYLPHEKDVYGRYDAVESIAFKGKFLQKPIVDIWAMRLKEIFLKKYPSIKLAQRSYKFISTIDVDNAFAYKGKGFVRTAGALLRSVINRDITDLSERVKAVLKLKPDPYDVFDYLIEIQKKYNTETVYFFLVADYGHNDKNVPVTNRDFVTLIKSVSDYAKVGVHPSFASNTSPEKIKVEIKRLTGIIHKEINSSRQHFLIFRLPDTYRLLAEAGITDEYSMGYASEPGFRAGTSVPFMFYDLMLEKETKLKVHPFCIMEATYKYYKYASPDIFLDEVEAIIHQVKKVNGTVCTLWHNDFISDYGEYKGWKIAFEKMIELAV
jgi:hypothetical protein